MFHSVTLSWKEAQKHRGLVLPDLSVGQSRVPCQHEPRCSQPEEPMCGSSEYLRTGDTDAGNMFYKVLCNLTLPLPAPSPCPGLMPSLLPLRCPCPAYVALTPFACASEQRGGVTVATVKVSVWMNPIFIVVLATSGFH